MEVMPWWLHLYRYSLKNWVGKIVFKREKRLFDIENIAFGNNSLNDFGSNLTTKVQILSISFLKMTCEL